MCHAPEPGEERRPRVDQARRKVDPLDARELDPRVAERLRDRDASGRNAPVDAARRPPRYESAISMTSRTYQPAWL